MRIHEFVDEGLGHSSYLIEMVDRALVIDPPRFPIAHEELARQLGTPVGWTADTHSHADYVSGSLALAARSGARFLAPAASRLEVPHHPLGDDEVVELGDGCSLHALASPGHTPDHMAYVLRSNGEPVALFSGGSLMVGTVGRTDLLGADQADPLARQMFRSLRDRILTLPDELAVYPTHGAGSFCSAPGTPERTTTIGSEKRGNPLLDIADEDNFVDALLAGFGSFPTYFGQLPALNRRGPRRYDALPDLHMLDLDAFASAVDDEAVIVDARPISAFASGHIPGSLSNSLRPVFATWLGWLVASDRPLVFVLDADQDRSEVVRQCLDIGHERLLGELAGGMDAWTTHDRATSTTTMADPNDRTGTVVDVRQSTEYRTGHLPSACNIELGAVPTATMPAGPLTIMCGHGERAMTAASILGQRGQHDLQVLEGGPDDWAAATGGSLEVTE